MHYFFLPVNKETEEEQSSTTYFGTSIVEEEKEEEVVEIEVNELTGATTTSRTLAVFPPNL